jgi:hypothetical protein
MQITATFTTEMTEHQNPSVNWYAGSLGARAPNKARLTASMRNLPSQQNVDEVASFLGKTEQEDEREVRLEGKKFMLSVTFFLAIIGFQALAYSQLEGWLYSDSIYFSVQWPVLEPLFLSVDHADKAFSALRIGYGDLVPTNTWAKILVFPFFILTVSQLGNEIVIIFSFIRGRTEARRDKWHKRYEGTMHAEANRLRPTGSLMQEMALIEEINRREQACVSQTPRPNPIAMQKSGYADSLL